jgi:hypothetical protein
VRGARREHRRTPRRNDLGGRLADYVRLEEHEVFPLIEATIPETELQTLDDPAAAVTAAVGVLLAIRVLALALRAVGHMAS